MTGLAERKGRGRKISIVHIAQILLSESDAEHPLSQQKILTFLRERYGMEMDRKAVRRNLEALRDGGLPVVCREVERVIEGKPAPLSLDWYWDRDLTKEDMKALIDLLYFSHLPASEVRQLAQKLKNLYMRPFDDGKAAVKNIPALNQLEPPDETLAVLAEAIENKKMIQFFYDHYEADGKRYHGKDIGGIDRVYRVSPYVVAASDGRYFLLGNIDEKDEITPFAVELLDSVSLLEEEARPQKTIPGAEMGIRVSDFLSVLSRTYAGPSEKCRFEADWKLMTDIVTDFGKSAFIVSATQGQVLVEIEAPPAIIFAWALKNAPLVKVVAPAALVKSVREAAANLTRLYGGG